MLQFIKADQTAELHEGYHAKSISLTVVGPDGSRDLEVDFSGYMQDFSEFGTGLYTDQEFKVGSELELALHTPLEDGVWGTTRLRIMWSRLQDPDNITGICIRQMIFNLYDEQQKPIEPEILRLLHNPSRDSTAGLIQRFSIFSKENLQRLDILKQQYQSTHPRTQFRYGAKVLESGIDTWQRLVNQLNANFAPGQMDDEESEVMKQFNRRQARR